MITGAAQGIGRAYALRLADDGFRVVAVDLQDSDETIALVAESGGEAYAMRCDVADEISVAAMSEEVSGRFGGADVLVNNAMSYARAPIDETDFADWNRVMGVGVHALFLVSRAFVPGMRERGWGRIVNMTSNTFGLVLPSMVAYVTAKAAVIGFTRALASEAGPHGITVNCIAPGLTRTTFTETHTPERLFDDMVSMQAVKRSETPEDLVGALSFLVSDEASFITAQTIVVDGGLVRH